jgi:hypothetical protein
VFITIFAAFGVGNMIYSGLEVGQYFEYQEMDRECFTPLLAITPACRIVFTFIQMYFIFLNSKVSNRYCTIRLHLYILEFPAGLCEYCRFLGVRLTGGSHIYFLSIYMEQLFAFILGRCSYQGSRTWPALDWCTWLRPICAFGCTFWLKSPSTSFWRRVIPLKPILITNWILLQCTVSSSRLPQLVTSLSLMQFCIDVGLVDGDAFYTANCTFFLHSSWIPCIFKEANNERLPQLRQSYWQGWPAKRKWSFTAV